VEKRIVFRSVVAAKATRLPYGFPLPFVARIASF